MKIRSKMLIYHSQATLVMKFYLGRALIFGTRNKENVGKEFVLEREFQLRFSSIISLPLIIKSYS